jgi:peroxiredoxin
MNARSPSRLQELEEKFTQLEPELRDTPEKQAIMLLHALLHESRRGSTARDEPERQDGVTLEAVANLYKTAPAMEGRAENEGLKTGVEAPDFTLPDQNGEQVRLSDFRGTPVVLVFYPLDWSPACSDQLSLYQSELDELGKYGARILALSVDSIYSHGAWAAVRGIAFPLLADFHPKGEVARRYQVWRDSSGFSERALFVIDAKGVIRHKDISPELDHIPDIYQLFDQLKMLQAQPAQASSR